MPLEKSERAIGAHTYTVTQLGAKVGNKVLLKLAKGLGPLFVLAAAGAGLDARTAAGALKDLSEEDFDWIVGKLAEATDVDLGDGRAPRLSTIFDLHFASRYDEEFEWLEFAIEVNYGPFFAALKRRAVAAAAARDGATRTPSPSTSPSTSTGASSAS